MSRHGSEHGTILHVLAVLILVAVTIVAGVAVVAMGRGGEMAKFTADVRPLDADIETAADVALLRPPAAMWGYDKRATDEALNAVAQTVTDRDIEIAALRQQLADLQVPRPGGLARSSAAGRPDAAGPPRTAGQAQAGAASQGQSQTPGQAQLAAAGQGQLQAPGPGQPAAPGQAHPGTGQTPPAGEDGSGTWSAWERSKSRPADEVQQEESG